jgi:hypothetical protein
VRFIVNISLVAVVGLYSCTQNATDAVSPDAQGPFKWIEGKFIYVDDHSGYYYEEWQKVDENNYSGAAYFLTRDCVDTIFSLKMQLLHEAERTTLLFDVKDQAKTKESEFTLSKGENNLFVFENPFRDFPSILQYRLYGDTMIDVVQRGFSNNKEKVLEYKAKRID